jgi:hypothetical protein
MGKQVGVLRPRGMCSTPEQPALGQISSRLYMAFSPSQLHMATFTVHSTFGPPSAMNPSPSTTRPLAESVGTLDVNPSTGPLHFPLSTSSRWNRHGTTTRADREESQPRAAGQPYVILHRSCSVVMSSPARRHVLATTFRSFSYSGCVDYIPSRPPPASSAAAATACYACGSVDDDDGPGDFATMASTITSEITRPLPPR